MANTFIVFKEHPTCCGEDQHPQLLQQYAETVAMEYYRNHLEEYNKEFASQLKEFKDGNLLFEIMQRKVWDKAAADSTGLKNYYSNIKTNTGGKPAPMLSFYLQ